MAWHFMQMKRLGSGLKTSSGLPKGSTLVELQKGHGITRDQQMILGFWD
jgi:hypothetical protein